MPPSRPCRHACSLAWNCGLVGESVVAEVGRSVLPDVALFWRRSLLSCRLLGGECLLFAPRGVYLADRALMLAFWHGPAGWWVRVC